MSTSKFQGNPWTFDRHHFRANNQQIPGKHGTSNPVSSTSDREAGHIWQAQHCSVKKVCFRKTIRISLYTEQWGGAGE